MQLCTVCAEVVEVDGASIMLATGTVAQATMGATDAISSRIEELQYTLGEGPCLDALALGRPVMESDLVRPVVPRWSAFRAGAITAGVRAIFGFPLRGGQARLGALDLYRTRAGPLTADQHADALVVADLVAETLLLMQADATPEGLGPALAAHADFRFVVHQASGAVSVQLGVSVEVALVRLRAYAFANDVRLVDVATDVVARRLRFD